MLRMLVEDLRMPKPERVVPPSTCYMSGLFNKVVLEVCNQFTGCVVLYAQCHVWWLSMKYAASCYAGSGALSGVCNCRHYFAVNGCAALVTCHTAILSKDTAKL